MPTMVVLVEGGPGAGALDPGAASELGALGVTSVTVVRDAAGLGVVLDGWAFDPERAGREAAAIVSAGRDARTLLPLLQTAVSSERRSG